MALLTEREREHARSRLAAIARPVTVLLFTQTIDPPESVLAATQVANEIAALHEHVAVEAVDILLERERAVGYGIDRAPAIVLVAGGSNTRIRFLGAPAGYELTSFVEALVLAGTGRSGLSPAVRALMAEHVTRATHIRVFVTPTCRFCPAAVTLAHRMAVEHPLVTATCIDATEFLDLSRDYRVTGVPKTVVNDGIEIFGTLAEAEFARAALGLAAESDAR